MENLVRLLNNGFFFKKEFNSKNDFFEFADQFLQSKYIVNSRFLPMIIERELHYPTGLITSTIPVAIPHTEFESVEMDSILICSFIKPLQFNRMDNPDEILDVTLAFLLLIKNKDNHINFLMDLMTLLQSNKLSYIKEANTLQECIQIIKEIADER